MTGPLRARPPLRDCDVPGILQASCDSNGQPETLANWQVKLATYNANSLKAEHVRQQLDHEIVAAEFAAVGIQESRCCFEDRYDTQHFRCICGSDEKGHLGCQLWLNKSRPVAVHGAGGELREVYWDIDSAAILVNSVTVRAAKQLFAFCVAHAPTEDKSRETVLQWWCDFEQVFRQIPRQAIPLVLIDGNARFEACACQQHVTERIPSNLGAEQLHAFLSEHELEGSGSHDTDGNQVVTWVSPLGNPAQVDYVLFPSSLTSSANTLGKPRNFQDPTDFDHEVMGLELSWVALAGKGKQKRAWDTRAMGTMEGRAILSQIFLTVPVVHWTEHPDVHLHAINQHIFRGLQQHFVRRPDSPRMNHVSDVLWQAARSKRHTRRILRQGAYGSACRF